MNKRPADLDQGYDCEALISTKFVNKLLATLQFPMELAVIADTSNLVNALAVPFRADGSSQAQVLDADQGDDLVELVEEVATPSSPGYAPPSSQPRTKIAVTALSVTLARAPQIHLTLPPRATDITLRVFATLRFSYRLFGRWRSIEWRVKDALLQEQQAQLQLSYSEGKLRILPVLSNLQLQLPLKLLTWKPAYAVDITQIVNRHLRANELRIPLPPTVIGIPAMDNEDVHVSVSELDFRQHESGLMLCSNFRVHRTHT